MLKASADVSNCRSPVSVLRIVCRSHNILICRRARSVGTRNARSDALVLEASPLLPATSARGNMHWSGSTYSSIQSGTRTDGFETLRLGPSRFKLVLLHDLNPIACARNVERAKPPMRNTVPCFPVSPSNRAPNRLHRTLLLCADTCCLTLRDLPCPVVVSSKAGGTAWTSWDVYSRRCCRKRFVSRPRCSRSSWDARAAIARPQAAFERRLCAAPELRTEAVMHARCGRILMRQRWARLPSRCAISCAAPQRWAAARPGRSAGPAAPSYRRALECGKEESAMKQQSSRGLYFAPLDADKNVDTNPMRCRSNHLRRVPGERCCPLGRAATPPNTNASRSVRSLYGRPAVPHIGSMAVSMVSPWLKTRAAGAHGRPTLSYAPDSPAPPASTRGLCSTPARRRRRPSPLGRRRSRRSRGRCPKTGRRRPREARS